ncbi:carbon-phosphorus lyase [Erwinia psidii]|uniref:MBL fold metallo-hydrolase n=1 Tax=Erwinia psidii TaxID=69224 RepID=UPI00226B889B|nr:MBL fold metallo-hydrolase [Erwinia psidii]MCX8956785.1 carbon-phosphorus lyase [Erwinia psidii]
MHVHFLGTASSEGIPNPFCSCDLCEQSRTIKGKDIRTRSCVIIDEILQIDIAPEYHYQLIRDGLNARKIKDLLFTHTHADHFNIGELYSRMEGFGHHIDHSLNIYGNDVAVGKCAQLLEGFSDERFKLRKVVPFVESESNGYRITPLLANHAIWEFCYIYFIEKEGRSILYGHDSGWFPELTWHGLQNKKIDLCILECTLGYNGNSRANNHMSVETILATRERLYAMGCLTKQSKILLSHISHNVKMNHSEFNEKMCPHGIAVAYDGLTINL